MKPGPLVSCMLALLVFPPPAVAVAQSGRAGAVLQTFSFDEAAVGIAQAQLLTLPIELTWALRRAWFRVEGVYADGILTYPGGGYSTVSGVTDTHIVAGSSVSVLSVRALAVLPSGDSRYSADEVALLGVLASELLPFEIESWGSGGAFGGEAEIAAGRGRWTVDLAGGYVAARAHNPFESAEMSYRPGNEARLRLTIASRLGRASSLGVVAGFQHTALESSGDQDLYRAGDRWEVEVALAHPFGARESASVRAGMYTRSAGSVVPPLAIGAQILPGIVGSSGRRLLTLGADVQVARGGLVIVPAGEVRVLRTDDGIGEGWLSTLGVSVDRLILGRRYGTRLVGSTTGAIHLGSIAMATGGGAPVRGWEIRVTARLEVGG
jgi:hypothetical protein